MHASALPDTQQLTYQAAPASKVDRIDRVVVRCGRGRVISEHVQELSMAACPMYYTMIWRQNSACISSQMYTHTHTHTLINDANGV